jgi:putative FmdB family regulatory protein
LRLLPFVFELRWPWYDIARDPVVAEFGRWCQMAVYEYLCPKCRKEFELMRPMSEAEKPARCPECGAKVLKLISGVASKTGDSIQSPGKPFRKGVSVKASASASKGKSVKTRTPLSKKHRSRR